MTTAADLIRRFAGVSQVLDKADMAEVHRLCESCKAFFHRKVRDLVANFRTEPVLLSYSSDGMPLTVKHTITKGVAGAKVRRSGGSMHEFLIQRAFLQAASGDRAIIFRDPVQLVSKSADSSFSAAMEFLPTLRELGHRGLAVHHYCWDRAVYSPLERRVKQLHMHVAKQLAVSDASIDGKFLYLTNWIFASGCCNHDAHNALKWAMANQEPSPDCLKSLFIVMESLRNGYHLVAARLATWIPNRLVFRAVEHACLPELWCVLGIEPEWCQRLVDLGLWYDSVDDKLYVSPDYANDPEVLEVVSSILLHIWRFRRFTESRWISLGDSSRTLVASLMVGLGSVVTEILDDPACSNYHIGGFQHLSSDLTRFATLTSLVAYPSDAALQLLLKDDRVAQNVEGFKATISSEIEFVSSISAEVWELLAGVSDCSSGALRSDAIDGVHVIGGFMTYRIFKHLYAMPWALCVGDDLPQNLSGLKAGGRPTEQTARKIYDLLQLDFPVEHLIAGLNLARQASWSTVVSEQGHASASSLRKAHSEYGADTLCSRSMLHMMRPLLTQSKPELYIVKLRTQLAKLDHRMPQHLTGRHMFMKGLSEAAMAKRKNDQVPGGVQREIVKLHGASWHKLSQPQQRKLDNLASRESDERRLALQEEKDHCVSALKIARQRSKQELVENASGPFRVSSCSLSHAEMQQLDDLSRTPAFAGGSLTRLREEAMSPPGELSSILLDTFDSLPEPAPKVTKVSRKWLPLVCEHRVGLSDCAVRYKVADAFKYAKFVYAYQSPYLACFVRLKCIEQVLDCAPLTAENWQEAEANQWEHRFEVIVVNIEALASRFWDAFLFNFVQTNI